MLRRAVIAVLSLIALLGGVLATAAPSHAADLGAVTVSYSNFTYSVSPGSLAGSSGDTFSLANTLTSGNSNPVYYVSLMNDTGSVSLGGTSCTLATDCQVLDVFAGTASGTFTVTGSGDIKVMRFYQSAPATQIGTITITSGSSSTTVADPALVYPTAYLDPNGGTCTGALQFTKFNGMNGTITLPTSTDCSQSRFTLQGWARTATDTTIEFTSGQVVPIGDESFTLYAVWQPDGVQITYDAGVPTRSACINNGVNTSDRIAPPVVVALSSSLATSAPCTPLELLLSKWRVMGSDAFAAPGAPISALGAVNGSRISVYAAWTVEYGISLMTTQSTVSVDSPVTVTVKATVSGSPATNATVKLSVPDDAPVSLPGGGTSATVVTNARGEAAVAISTRDGKNGQATLTAAYGDKTAAIGLVVPSTATEKSIVITGERGTVGGKPGVIVNGDTIGFKKDDTVIVHYRFPGETTYSQASARPVIDATRAFTWQRKTGKKIYVYVTSQDESVKSGRIIIPAN